MSNTISFKDLEPRKTEDGMTFICLCPEHCPRKIRVSVNHGWGITEDEKGNITFKHSVRTRPCKAHYFVRAGVIDFCSDSGSGK